LRQVTRGSVCKDIFTRLCRRGKSLERTHEGNSQLLCMAVPFGLCFVYFFFLFEWLQGLVARIVNTRRQAKFQGPSKPGTGPLSTNQFSLVGQVTETDVWAL